MTAPEIILQLIERFKEHRLAYLSGRYNETQLRRDFLDPFFGALGWDMTNQKNHSERYREVIHEVSVEVEGGAKAADYAFRVGEKTVFFVEAKKPSANIETNPEPAFQLRRYGWSGKLPLSLLTDFEHLAVYDCRARPVKTDRPSLWRVRLYHYSEYTEKWDEIAAIFSHEAVLGGAFDQFAEGTRGRKGTTEVDDEFLAEIERWRDLLARNIALRNPSIQNERELNFAVQMTIDRIIFLRICEERGIEPDEQMHTIAKGTEIYPELLALFQRADTKYNSGLFHFADDKVTPGLVIDDRVLKDILHNLYYPESPYVFNYIPADILGQVYEQFLGKVIRLTAGHQAKVEEKPEVRKAGGVYYTPTYIVDYIVKNTVGNLLEGKTPKEAAALKILDPACGSGSFLLGAYQHLLDWHANWYATHEPEKWARGADPALYQAGSGEWRLTTSEKKRILLNNIHGVDIDLQAVEVTKLSLLLKVLESASGQMTLGLERALPDLDKNIQCGNSLIGYDYYEGRMLVDQEERERVNAFNWQAAFPQVFTVGGFDAVIGNPPYIRIQTMSPDNISYLSGAYETAIGNYDIYCPFLEKAVGQLNDKGYASFILPHRFFKTDYGDGLRTFLSNRKVVKKIIDFDGYMVFADASINTCIIVLSKSKQVDFQFTQIRFIKRPEADMPEIMKRIDEIHNLREKELTSGTLLAQNLSNSPWIFVYEWEKILWEKLSSFNITLGDISRQIFQGLKTGADAIFSVQVVSEHKNYAVIHSSADDQNHEIELEILFPQLKGGEMKRYLIGETNRAVIFPYSKGKLIDAQTIQSKFPLTWNYLQRHKKYLEDREDGKVKGSIWYGYTRNQALSSMQQPKIMTPDYYAHASYCLDKDGKYFFFGGGAGGYGIVLNGYNSHFILGLLNSKLLDWYIRKISVRQYQTAYSYVKKFIEQLPIRTINFTDPVEKAAHDRMVSLVERMLCLHKQTARTPQEKEFRQREIASTDQAIDALVYQLYGLSKEEIRIVEGG